MHTHIGNNCIGATFKWRLKDLSCKMPTSASYFLPYYLSAIHALQLILIFQLILQEEAACINGGRRTASA